MPWEQGCEAAEAPGEKTRGGDDRPGAPDATQGTRAAHQDRAQALHVHDPAGEAAPRVWQDVLVHDQVPREARAVVADKVSDHPVAMLWHVDALPQLALAERFPVPELRDCHR